MKVYIFPGQGSQIKGMGGELFEEFSEYTNMADKILGYSIRELCINDPERKLSNTEFTQPALYVVNCLTYLKRCKTDSILPNYFAGHSLGEYSALFAAGAFSFDTGLKIVKKRGELMAQAKEGSMAAILHLNSEKIRKILVENNLNTIDVANYNSSIQTVIAGPTNDIITAQIPFENAGAIYVSLNVSAAFHSRYMKPAADEFEKFLHEFQYASLTVPVIANVNARPYKDGSIIENLKKQLWSSVQWEESIRYLMGKGQFEYQELGPGDVLTKLINTIKNKSTPLHIEEELVESNISYPEEQKRDDVVSTNELNGQEHKSTEIDSNNYNQNISSHQSFTPETLGSESFRHDYNLRYAYYTGAMYKGIASKEIVVKMGKAGLMGFLGTGGLSVSDIEKNIIFIQKELNRNESYGMNFLHQSNNNLAELQIIDLYLKYSIRVIEASAFTHITPALVKYKLQGLKQNTDGSVETQNKIIAKISRPELLREFLSPAPKEIVQQLLDDKQITPDQARLGEKLPMANDICAEANSGGHTDGAVALVLLPTMVRIRNRLCLEFGYQKKVRVGAAGGLGTPEAIAAAFLMGADFVVTGSINQCTVEAGTSDRVKDMLQNMNIQDTDFAPAADMFEIGAKVQVLKKGVFFPARANKLYELWRNHDSWESINSTTRDQIEKKFFSRSFAEVYAETRDFYNRVNPIEIERAEASPKHKMALVFRWYFIHTNRMALTGNIDQSVNFQIHTGPAMGAFNQWVLDTELRDWRKRHVDNIAEKLIIDAAMVLNNFYTTKD